MSNNKRELILDQPAYWLEGINGFLFEAVQSYMEKNDLNRTKLAEHLGISKGRVSQILNDGEMNFSLAKIIELALKVDKFPVFELMDKQEYLQSESTKGKVKKMEISYNSNKYSEFSSENSLPGILSIPPHKESRIQHVL